MRWLSLAIATLPLLLLALHLRAHNPEDGSGSFLPCLFYKATGFYCPGCGSTRAAHQILNLDVAAAMRKNVAFVVVLPFIVFGCLAMTFRWLFPEKPSPFDPILTRVPSSLALWFLGLMIVYGVVRNLPFAPFAALAPH